MLTHLIQSVRHVALKRIRNYGGQMQWDTENINVISVAIIIGNNERIFELYSKNAGFLTN